MHNIKESTQYLVFFKQNFLLLLLGVSIGIVGALWINYQIKPVYVAERLFQFTYTQENAVTVEKETNQVVTVLRSAQLKEQMGLQQTTLVIYKPGPFGINISAKSHNAESAVVGVNKLAAYLTGSYQVKEIGSEVFYVEKQSDFKNLFLGLLSGIGLGLLVSLVITYFKHY